MANANHITTDDVLGMAGDKSPQGLERLSVHKDALDAHDKAELDKLFAAYQATVKDRAKVEDALFRVHNLLGKDGAQEHLSIGAIRDVALAAIELARDVALKVE